MSNTAAYVNQLKEKKLSILQGARQVYADAAAASREITGEERANAEKALADTADLDKQIELAERQIQAESAFDGLGRQTEPDPLSSSPTPSNPAPVWTPQGLSVGTGALPPGLFPGIASGVPGLPMHVQGGDGVFTSWSQIPGLSWETMAQMISPFTPEAQNPLQSREYNARFPDYLVEGDKSSQYPFLRARSDALVGRDESGGFLAAPVQMASFLLKELDDALYLLRWGRVFRLLKSRSLGVVSRERRANTFDWGTEVSEPTKDASLSFGARELEPHPLSGEIDTSWDFLRTSSLNPVQIVVGEMRRDAGEKMEDGFLVGPGVKQPLGTFTPSPEGIPTSRDISTGNTTTEMKFDGLKHSLMDIKDGYRRSPKFRFLTSRKGMLQLWLEKDGNLRPLWELSLKVGEPDRVLGVPAVASDRVPDVFTPGNYVGIWGDFDKYWIVFGLDLRIRRLDEIEARRNKVVFLGRLMVDGQPVLGEAFRRVQLAFV